MRNPPHGLHWLKTTDPSIGDFAEVAGADVRVLLPDSIEFLPLRDKLAAQGVAHRAVKYWFEHEAITENSPAAAREAFDLVWQAEQSTTAVQTVPVPVSALVPEAWTGFMPYAALNPAQAQAAPEVLDHRDHLLVVAPTGAGKTVIGMMGVLRAVLTEGGKAAWLVPQRSLTDELTKELEAWRRSGLRVERLSGEEQVDARGVREADLWVSTTEKFEALCRTTSFREALAEINCLVVDEIHLLGDRDRGPVLEALLTRARDRESPTRIIGLSATVSNATSVADWLRARLVRIDWRPSLLTWQIPIIPASSDWRLTEAARTLHTNAIVRAVTADDGSVLVFCGSRRNVRSTALAIAASRGVDTQRVAIDDLESVHRTCKAAGVHLHYKDWEHKSESERAFRNREANVLVATSTLAAGVNLPARAVIVRDTRVGMREVDVATVQQMFGRAGRTGAGENAGWAFLLADESERADWQGRLAGGYSVASQIRLSLADHVLAEVVQQRIRTLDDAERWWSQTFAYHQGTSGANQVREAVGFLVGADYLVSTSDREGNTELAATELGLLTARLMVEAETGHQLRSTLARLQVPRGAEDAEHQLIDVISALVPKLAQAPISESLKPAVTSLLNHSGRIQSGGSSESGEPEYAEAPGIYRPGDLARVSLSALAADPEPFMRHGGSIAGVPTTAMLPVLEAAPRYLHWLGSQGYFGTVHPWCAIVAADLSRRVRWRRCAPPRGSGRILWMFEQMATTQYASHAVPAMWDSARKRSLRSPDWTSATPPRSCNLGATAYAALLQERVTGSHLAQADGIAAVSCARGKVFVAWSGRVYKRTTTQEAETRISLPEAPADHGMQGCALFSRRGDYLALGWLQEYAQTAD